MCCNLFSQHLITLIMHWSYIEWYYLLLLLTNDKYVRKYQYVRIQCHWGRQQDRPGRSCPRWSSTPSPWTRSPVWMLTGPMHQMLAPKAICWWVGIRWRHLDIQWGALDSLGHGRRMNRCIATYVRTWIMIRAMLMITPSTYVRMYVRTHVVWLLCFT